MIRNRSEQDPPAGHLAVWENGSLRLERYARPMPAPAEPEPMPAAAWAVQRIGTRPQHRPERATRVGSRQEQPETQDAPHEAEP